jgi:tRNA1Val (adenine37-N6)-methyltransferase
MANSYFRFKHFTVYHDRCAMKVTTDGCSFGAWCADEIKASNNAYHKLLDIGTGTGLLSLMVAQKNESIQIDAVEIDQEASSQARENITASPWKERISVYAEDILNFLTDDQYDIIISNPPFYENELKSGKEKKDLAHHSEELKLEQICSIIQTRLNAGGNFFLLLPAKRKEEINRLLTGKNLFIHKLIGLRQSVDHGVFRLMISGGRSKPAEILYGELAIWNEAKTYTAEFIDLLKDYYLYL